MDMAQPASGRTDNEPVVQPDSNKLAWQPGYGVLASNITLWHNGRLIWRRSSYGGSAKTAVPINGSAIFSAFKLYYGNATWFLQAWCSIASANMVFFNALLMV